MPKGLADKMMEAYKMSGSRSGKNVFAQTLMSIGADVILLGTKLSSPDSAAEISKRLESMEGRLSAIERSVASIMSETAQTPVRHSCMCLRFSRKFVRNPSASGVFNASQRRKHIPSRSKDFSIEWTLLS